MKHVIKGLEEALAAQNLELAESRLREAVSVIDRTSGKGVIHKNHAARKISRLTQKVNALVPSA